MRTGNASGSGKSFKDDFEQIVLRFEQDFTRAIEADPEDASDFAMTVLTEITEEGVHSEAEVAWAFAMWARLMSYPHWLGIPIPRLPAPIVDQLRILGEQLPVYLLLQWADRMAGCLRDLPPGVCEEAQADQRRRRPLEPFTFAYSRMGDFGAELFDRAVLSPPQDRPLPIIMDQEGRKCLLFVRLFSGRRRDQDYHHWISVLGAEIFKGYGIWVLSVDTAVDIVDGNLAHGPAVDALQKLTTCSAIAATAAGPPCETWTAAA